MSGKAATGWLDVSPHEAATTMSSVREVGRGLPLVVADRLSSSIAPGDATFKYRFVPKPTYTRRRAKGPSAVLSSDESERVVRISRIWALAQAVWGGAVPARRFMLAPHMLLDGQSPLDVALSGELGGKLVEEILGRLAHGTAA